MFEAIDAERLIGYVTATTLTDIFYIARKHTGNLEKARQAIFEILTVMEVCSIDKNTLEAAINSGFVDFEDAVQIFSAVAHNLDAIVTRDSKGFLDSPIFVMSTRELVQKVETQNGG